MRGLTPHARTADRRGRVGPRHNLIVTNAAGNRLWSSYLAWLAVGALCAVTLLGAMTIGVFVLPLAIAATIVVARRPAWRSGVAGLLAGAAIPLLYVAYLNRDGPGNVCSRTVGGESCTQEWSPWPFIAVAAILVLASLVLTQRTHRASRI